MYRTTRVRKYEPRRDHQCGDWPFRLGRYPGETSGSLLLVCAVLDKAWQENDQDFIQCGYYEAYGNLFEVDLPRVFRQYKTPAIP